MKTIVMFVLVVIAHLVTANSIGVAPNAVVALDGSGQFRSITAAIAAVPMKSNVRFIIYIKTGVYKEHVEIPAGAPMIEMYGDGPNKTVISDNKNYAAGTKTWYTATLTVLADNFFAHDIGIENTAGSIGQQAVALLVSADRAVFYNVRIDGYQDTLCTHRGSQFYRDCDIYGTIDFVFGSDALAIFQNCKFIVRKPLDGQACMVTAQGRDRLNSSGAIVIQNGNITTDASLLKASRPVSSYLGRPWKPLSRTIIMDSNIDGFISPEGWAPWDGAIGLDTLYYAEFHNRGPGSNQERRVNWTGIRHIGPLEAQIWTPKSAFGDDEWIRLTGIPYLPS